MLSIRKIVDSYFSKRTFPHWCVLLLDSAILFLSGVFVYWCFNRGTALQLNFWPLTYLMLLCVGVHFIFFAIFRTYSGIIRYSSATHRSTTSSVWRWRWDAPHWR